MAASTAPSQHTVTKGNNRHSYNHPGRRQLLFLLTVDDTVYSSANEFYGHEPTFPPPSLSGPLVRCHIVGIQSSEDQTFFKPWIMILPEPLQEGNGTPLQYSCLENPLDGGAW